MPSKVLRAKKIYSDEELALKDLRRIPGVGKSIALDFYAQGFRSVDELKGREPDALYQRQCEIQGCHVDRCWLYVARLAVYFAETPEQEQEKAKLLWWNWKD
ncbi:MAG: pathogenicity locus [Burkholderiales bacterium]|nr:pathogenicity locus [Burkholderiales bacterium]